MSKSFIFPLMALSAIFFAACSEDSTNNSNNSEQAACSVSKNDDGESYTLKCLDGTEVVIHDGKDGSDGKDGEKGSDGKNGTDGKDGEDGSNGKDGENGADGKNGEDGADGKNGNDGKDGDSSAGSATGCTLKELDGGSMSLECPDGTKLVFGDDGKVVKSSSSSSIASEITDVSSSSSKPVGSSSSINPTGKTQGYVQFNKDVYGSVADLVDAGIYLYDADNMSKTALVTVYADTPDSLQVTLERYDQYYYAPLPMMFYENASGRGLHVEAGSALVAKYVDQSTGIAEFDSSLVKVANDSVYYKARCSISFGKSAYYDTTDKAVITLRHDRLLGDETALVRVRSEYSDIMVPVYPVVGGDPHERIGFVGFALDNPSEGEIKVSDGATIEAICDSIDGGVLNYGTIYYTSASATWKMSEFFGLTCAGDGSLQKGIKETSKTYVCDAMAFRLANELEISLGKGCSNYNEGDSIKKSSKFYSYTCKCHNSSWNVDPKRKASAFGTLVDSRDNKSYYTIKIGNQVWMAENLAHEYKVGGKSYGTYFADSLKDYGYYYTWAAAMDSAGVYSTNGAGCGYGKSCTVKTPARGICPKGWHIPDSTEWKTLYSAIGGTPYSVIDGASYAMQAMGYPKWSKATDDYGFSALPAGYLSGGSHYYDVGEYAYFWSAAEGNRSYDAYYWGMSASGANLSCRGKSGGFAVRCLQD